jgi:hypothetical protein
MSSTEFARDEQYQTVACRVRKRLLEVTMPNHPAPQLSPWELAEAEAESDVIDADLEVPAASAARPQTPAGPTTATETELTQAEYESDLSHSDPDR